MNLHRFLFTFLLISLSEFCCRSYALRCYICSTDEDKSSCPEEGSEVDPSRIEKCMGSCSILSFWLFSYHNYRSCVKYRPTNDCRGSWIGKTCYCNKDLCNREA